MNFFKNSYFIFGALASILSLFFYGVLEESISNNIEGMIAASGFLVAASWGFLQNETNKEIKIRDEVISFIGEYEDSVVKYIEECNSFGGLFFTYYHLCKRSDLRLVVAKEKIEDVSSEDFGKLKDVYGDVEIFKLFEVIRNQHNICAMRRNVVALKGGLLKEYVSCKETVSEIDDKCRMTLAIISRASEAANLGASEPVIELEDEDFKFIVRSLGKVIGEKVKGFNTRSRKYNNAANACVFFTMFGFFFFLWSLLGI